LLPILERGLLKVSEAVATLPAVIMAVVFLLGVLIGNIASGGKLDPGFQISNWFMNGVGFVMFFLLACIAKKGSDHAEGAHTAAKKAEEHAGAARMHAYASRVHLRDAATDAAKAKELAKDAALPKRVTKKKTT
jgi:hypothetical protein